MEASDLVPGFSPESDLERAVAADPELLEGLRWGKPRRGHPEGTVGAHVADLLSRIDQAAEPAGARAALRFIALVHDSQKHRVRDWQPRSGENHHAMRARRLVEGYTRDEALLSAIELHDRPYALWRGLRRGGTLDERRFEDMIRRLPDLGLFVRFVELDGSTEGKSPEPVRWFREELRRRQLLQRPA